MGYRLRDRVVLSVFENNKLVSDRAKSKLTLNLTHNSTETIKSGTSSNAYNDVTEFEVCEFIINYKNLNISRPKHYFFFQYKNPFIIH